MIDQILVVALLTLLGLAVLMGTKWLADRLYPKRKGGLVIMSGDRPPPAVEADILTVLTLAMETGATEVFAVRHGDHLVAMTNENAARCSCGWKVIAQADDLDDVVREHFSEVES